MRTSPPLNHESTKIRKARNISFCFVFSSFVFLFSCLGGGAGRLLAQEPQGPSLTLAEALEMAEKQSETVGLARADLARAQGQGRQARSAYFPQLTGSASYQRTIRSQFSALSSGTDTTTAPAVTCNRFVPNRGLPIAQRLDSLENAVKCASESDPFASFRNLPFGRKNIYRFGLSFSQTLFAGGQLRGQSQAAGAGIRIAVIGLTAARAQVLLDVTGAYYDAALADRLLSIAQATLEQADTTLSQTQLARQVGNLSEFDLLRARVTRDNQRPVVIQRHADRDQAYYRLKQLLDLSLDQPLHLSTELGDTALTESSRVTDVVEKPGDTTTTVRAPVRQAAEGVTAQRGLLRVARGQRWPQVALTSQYAQLAFPEEISPFGTDFVSDWSVSLGLQVPLFTGGRIGGDVAVARANVSQAELRLQQARELAEVDSRNAITQLEAARAGWEASAGTVEQAARAYQIAELRYREGISTQTELLDSRVQLQQAQASRARAARDLQVARMRIALLPALPLVLPSGTPVGTTQSGVSIQSGAITVPTYQPPPAPAEAGTTGIQQGVTGP
jgi:outer membrane protein